MKYQISITGYIGSWTKRMVHDILNENKGKHVDVAIDSLGGAVSAGLAICQMFKNHGDVTVDFQAGFISVPQNSSYGVPSTRRKSAHSSNSFRNSRKISRKLTTSSPMFTAIAQEKNTRISSR